MKEGKDYFLTKENCEYLVYFKSGSYCKKINKLCSSENCPKSPPSISNGTTLQKPTSYYKGGANGITPKQAEVFKLKNKGLSFQAIADKLNISKPSAYALYNKSLRYLGGANDKLGGLTKDKGGANETHKVSLHNDSIEIEANIKYSEIPENSIYLKYCEYKLTKTEDYVIKYFKNKLIIQFRKEIIAKSPELAKKEADKRIINFLKKKHYYFKITKEHKQLTRHYAILDTYLARKYYKEGERLFLYGLKGELRGFIDFSDKEKGGSPHFEFPNVKTNLIDSNNMKGYMESIINYPHYKPHETKGILDIILDVQRKYAEQIALHLKVEESNLKVSQETLKTLKAIQKNLKD